jgi:hypothetical protein
MNVGQEYVNNIIYLPFWYCRPFPQIISYVVINLEPT